MTHLPHPVQVAESGCSEEPVSLAGWGGSLVHRREPKQYAETAVPEKGPLKWGQPDTLAPELALKEGSFHTGKRSQGGMIKASWGGGPCGGKGGLSGTEPIAQSSAVFSWPGPEWGVGNTMPSEATRAQMQTLFSFTCLGGNSFLTPSC